MIPIVAILAGGLATRLHPKTQYIPKILLEIAGEPFAYHLIELLKEHGIRKIVFCVGFLGEEVQATVGDGSRWGMDIQYAFDGPTLLGTGGAIKSALPRLGDTFFVLYGDSYLDCDYLEIAEAFKSRGKPGLMTVYRNRGRWDNSNVVYNNGQILRYDKLGKNTDMDFIDYGLGVFSPSAFEPYSDEIPLDLETVYQDLLQKGQLAAYEIMQRFFEIGSFEGLKDTEDYLKNKRG